MLPMSFSVIYRKAAGGSADPAINNALANVLRAAKAAGVPKDNIERAIARVSLASNFAPLPDVQMSSEGYR